MKIQDMGPARRRTFARAVTVIVVLALVSLALEWGSGSDLEDIVYSFATFGFILVVARIRFSTRSSDREAREKLWITAALHAGIGLVARLLPGGDAAPPAGPAPTAQQSPSPAVTLLRTPRDDRKRTHD
jgi:hypothetical protein